MLYLNGSGFWEELTLSCSLSTLQMCSPNYFPCQSSIPLTCLWRTHPTPGLCSWSCRWRRYLLFALPELTFITLRNSSPWNQLGDSAAIFRAQAYYAILTYPTLYYPNLGDFGVWPWRPWCPNSIVSRGPSTPGRFRNSWGPFEREKKKKSYESLVLNQATT